MKIFTVHRYIVVYVVIKSSGYVLQDKKCNMNFRNTRYMVEYEEGAIKLTFVVSRSNCEKIRDKWICLLLFGILLR